MEGEREERGREGEREGRMRGWKKERRRGRREEGMEEGRREEGRDGEREECREDRGEGRFPGMWRIWSPVLCGEDGICNIIKANSAEITGKKYKWEPYNPAVLLVGIHPRHRIQVLRSGTALPCSWQ